MVKEIDSISILKSAPDLYLVLDPSLFIVEASDAYLRATMVNRAEIIGHKVFEIFPDNPADPTATGTLNLNSSLQKVLLTKKPHEMKVQKYDIRRPLSEGGGFEERYWQPLNTPVVDEMNNVQYIIHRVEDVTELHYLKNYKTENSQRLQLLIENIKDYAIIMLDEMEHVITWNAGAEYIIGFKEEEVLGKPISMVFPTHSYDYEFKIAKADGRYEEDGWRERKGGSKFWANIIVIPVYNIKHQLIGYGKVISDLTVRKEIEAAKDEFISIVNHELRTPLTSIIGALKLLLSGSVTSHDKTMELLKTANTNSNHLLKLITDILEIEKLTIRGKINIENKEIELNQLIANTIAMNDMFSKEYGVSLTASVMSSTLKINIDPNRLIQVLTNLISNAIKFSTPGGAVNVSLMKKNNTVRIAVTNTGVGISEHFKDKIFEKFSQADVSTTRSNTGTGLGLAISQSIMKQFGSSIKYKSVPNKETTFYFDLSLE